MNDVRKLATIRRISELRSIEGADKIETAVIDGWTVVVKKGEFNVGDLCVYLEIDSWVPTTIAPFLTKSGYFPKQFNDVEGERLKTVKLRGQLSQGLVLPLSVIPKSIYLETYISKNGDDVTEILGIQKWEKPLHPSLAGTARGNFPSEIPKTDQERIQNLNRNIDNWLVNNYTWEVTEKLDGSSCTFYLDVNDVFHVCSRNLDLKEPEEGQSNTFWLAANKYEIERKLRNYKQGFAEQGIPWVGVAIQGEVIASNIQGNQYGLANGDIQFYVFDIYNVENKQYLNANVRKYFLNSLGIDSVPVLRMGPLPGTNVQELLTYAEGQSMLNNSEREGVVFKCIENPSISFKAISNKWLLKNE